MSGSRSVAVADTGGSKPPKYMAIADWLRERICSCEFAPGARLPSEHALMERFRVSRVTARQALTELRRIGLVESRQGKGHFVRQIQPVVDLQRLQSFNEMLAPFGVETRSNVIEILEVPADADVAEALRLQRGDPIMRVARTRLAGDTVLSLNISMFPLALGRRLVSLDISQQDIVTLMETRLDIEVGYADVTFDVVPADERYARFIGIETGERSFEIRRLTHDMSGAPIDFELICCRADALRFRARQPRW